MWFKMSFEIYNCAAARAIAMPAKARDNWGDTRLLIFTRLLIDAAGGRDDLQGVEDMARLYGTTQKQAAIVWEICERFGILRKGAKGYSAIDWMRENSLIGTGKPETTKDKRSRETQAEQRLAQMRSIFTNG